MVKVSYLLMGILLINTMAGCSAPPSENTVAEAIADYFERGNYRVIDLKIGKIEGVPLSEKRYMGTPGYVVHIDSITLAPRADEDIDIGKGREGARLTFSDALVRVTRDMKDKDLWRVTIISGIGVLIPAG
ncbi:MAG: hypothetical protein PVJ36_04045 [Nitrospirota bacterium]|jgi:hypothetical protein